MALFRTSKFFFAALLFAVLAIKPVWGAELMPLRATYASIGGAFAPLWIAQDKGLFSKYGLDVDLKYMLSATGTQALLSGPAVELDAPRDAVVQLRACRHQRQTAAGAAG